VTGKSKKSALVSKLVPDFALWARVSKTVEPFDIELAKELEKFESYNIAVKQNPVKNSHDSATIKKKAAKFVNSSALQFTGLDRRQQQKLLRGQVEIDARIDLHGETLGTARVKLWQFLSSCSNQNLRTVLVITGKGTSNYTRHTLHSRSFYDDAERTGRLRSAVPDWLYESEFRYLVSGFQPAHPKHGGGGAIYIKLKNQNR